MEKDFKGGMYLVEDELLILRRARDGSLMVGCEWCGREIEAVKRSKNGLLRGFQFCGLECETAYRKHHKGWGGHYWERREAA